MEDNQPLRGRTIALETRYDVRTQVLSSWPAERLPAMWGRATLAMEVSSTSMKVASVTVIAMIQGLIAGRQTSAFSSGGAAELIAGSKPLESLTCRGEATDLYFLLGRAQFLLEFSALPSRSCQWHSREEAS